MFYFFGIDWYLYVENYYFVREKEVYDRFGFLKYVYIYFNLKFLFRINFVNVLKNREFFLKRNNF